MKINGKTLIGFFCKGCKQHGVKSVKYIKSRIRVGRTDFYCSRKCADEAHSQNMRGEGNPNHGGTFHGVLSTYWPVGKRKEAARKSVETRTKNGSLLGDKNGRWKGGKKIHPCVICGKKSEFAPYAHRDILAGKRAPTCSVECSTAYSRRHIPLTSTSIEIRMAEELSRRGIEYVEQYILNDKFRLDFLLPEYDIVIECDGDYWHTLPDVVNRDRAKNAYIKTCGYSLYRFWEHEINADIEACVDVVMAEINSKELYRHRT